MDVRVLLAAAPLTIGKEWESPGCPPIRDKLHCVTMGKMNEDTLCLHVEGFQELCEKSNMQHSVIHVLPLG